MTWQVPAPQPASISRSRVSFCLQGGGGSRTESEGQHLGVKGMKEDRRSGSRRSPVGARHPSASDTPPGPPAQAPSPANRWPCGRNWEGGQGPARAKTDGEAGGSQVPQGVTLSAHPLGTEESCSAPTNPSYGGADRGPGPRTSRLSACLTPPSAGQGRQGQGGWTQEEEEHSRERRPYVAKVRGSRGQACPWPGGTAPLTRPWRGGIGRSRWLPA